jgi:hypothetical protein
VYVTPSTRIQEVGLISYHKTLAGYCKIFIPAGEESTSNSSSANISRELVPTKHRYLPGSILHCWAFSSSFLLVRNGRPPLTLIAKSSGGMMRKPSNGGLIQGKRSVI